jgi:hypothetical protein
MSGQSADPGVGVTGREAGYLIALKAELDRRGLDSTIDASGVRVRLQVLAGPATHPVLFGRSVLAAPCCDGTWWYWSPWAERIAPAGCATEAADKVMERFGPAGNRGDAAGDDPGGAAGAAAGADCRGGQPGAGDAWPGR